MAANDPRAPRDTNPDPITGAPGAHPLGTGAGAAVGATVGAVAGSVAGPIGAAAGAAIGGVTGGLVGKSAAEAVNPSAEVEYWREAFANRPYAHGHVFSDFEPVYYSTAAAYPTYAGRGFEDIEPDLARSWATNRASSRLGWQDVRGASKEAWERISTRHAERSSGNQHESAAVANDLIEYLYDGAEGFKQAAESVSNPAFQSGLRRFSQQRQGFIAELKPLVTQRGERPETSGTTMGALHRSWMGLKDALTSGDKPILAECERGEDAAVAKYRKVLESRDLPADLRRVIERQYTEVKQAHDTVRAWRDSVVA